MWTGTHRSQQSSNRHIKQFHDNAVAQTLNASQKLFDDYCTQRIWKMMNSEFMVAKEAILENEGKQAVLHAPNPSASACWMCE